MKKLLVCFMVGLVALVSLGGCTAEKEGKPIGMAVEFMDHAACAYIAQDKGWFAGEGLNISAYESYVTGMALAAALGRGDIQVAYMCLVPAINTYANAGVPLKIIAGTHRYGYGLVANPDKVRRVTDLENPDIRIGCVREGGAVDVLLHRIMDKYSLDGGKVLANIRRMNPPNQVVAVQTGQLDAALLPEQWATMAEELGFTMLLTAQDVWPGMQGSVLVVKEDLVNDHPDVVQKLFAVSQKATDWGNRNPEAAAAVVARQLQSAGGVVLPEKAGAIAARLEVTPEVLLRSMQRLEYTTDIDAAMVQEIIDYLVGLGYIKSRFNAADILDLRFN